MRVTVRLKLEHAERVLAFCRRHPGGVPAAQEAEMRLSHLLAQATMLMEQARLAEGEMEQALTTRDELARHFKQRVEVLLRLAATVAEQSAVSELRLRVRFRAAAPGTYLKAARQALDTAAAHQPLLLRYGMPSQMLEVLRSDLEALEAAHGRRLTAARVTAAASLDLAGIATEALRIVRHLDALNRIRFAAAPEWLAEWDGVRRVEWGREGGTRLGAPRDSSPPLRSGSE